MLYFTANIWIILTTDTYNFNLILKLCLLMDTDKTTYTLPIPEIVMVISRIYL